jgi:gamma-glutamyl-gamma-aminobutyraldehyde dehydrogenase
VQQARADGARIVTGGEKLLAETGGYFTGATVIND